MSDLNGGEDGVEMVTVPKDALKMLYECAKDYDRRIPVGGHNSWAAPFFELFEAVPRRRKDTA